MRRLFILALSALALGCQAPEPAPTTPAQAPVAVTTRAPAGLQARLEIAARLFGGRVGIAARDLEAPWTAAVNGEIPMPQQSVSKLWVAVAVFDAVDRGELGLADGVVVRPEDLSVFHQPIRDWVDADGFPTTVEALLRGALITSDNAANDVLIRRLGGPEAVQVRLERLDIAGIRLGDEERFLQASIAGVAWRPEHAFGRTFWADRALVPLARRTALLDAYVAAPMDGATPMATVEALARLGRGELLSAASTERLLAMLEAVETGPQRLKAGLPPGWRLAHKTGTGQVLGDRQTGFNDVGLMISPDGRRYAIAVFIADTRRSVPERQALMQEAARAVADHHANAAILAGLTTPPAPARRRSGR